MFIYVYLYVTLLLVQLHIDFVSLVHLPRLVFFRLEGVVFSGRSFFFFCVVLFRIFLGLQHLFV